MYLENVDLLGRTLGLDKKIRDLDLLKENFDKNYPRLECKSHPTIAQSFFRELSNFLGDEKNVDLTYFLLKKYVLKK